MPINQWRFFLSFLSILLAPIFFPQWHFLFFAPFIVATYYKNSLIGALWLSIFSGVIVGALSAGPLMGLHALVYALATLLLYGQRRHFFEDKLSTLPIMTLLFSIITTSLEWLISSLMGYMPPLSLRWFLTDLLLMALLDGLFAFLIFTLPFSLISIFSPHKFSRK